MINLNIDLDRNCLSSNIFLSYLGPKGRSELNHGALRVLEGEHKAREVGVERRELAKRRNGADVPVRTHDDERTCTATDAVSFMDLATAGTGNVRIVKKDPITANQYDN